jgi:hypothetical protein
MESWRGVDVALEVLPIRDAAGTGTGTETIVEFSFKSTPCPRRHRYVGQAIALLDSRGWLNRTDVLETDLILHRY